MRLIDADALIEGYKQLGYNPTEHPEESYMEGWCKGFNAAVDHCIHHVIHAPTIEERKRGKWISTDDGWDGEYFTCSVCGCPWTLIEGTPEDNGMNFCPNCGADMRGEQNE